MAPTNMLAFSRGLTLAKSSFKNRMSTGWGRVGLYWMNFKTREASGFQQWIFQGGLHEGEGKNANIIKKF
jgi:hypothetical protein